MNLDDLVQEGRREGISCQEIAEMVGITRQDVRKRYDRCRDGDDEQAQAVITSDLVVETYVTRKAWIRFVAPRQEYDGDSGSDRT